MDSGVETGNDSNDSLVTEPENVVAMIPVGTSGQTNTSVNNPIEVVTNRSTSTEASADVIAQPEASQEAFHGTLVTLQSRPNNSLVSATMFNSTPFVSFSLSPEDIDKKVLQFRNLLSVNEYLLPVVPYLEEDVVKWKRKQAKQAFKSRRLGLFYGVKVKLNERKLRLASAINNIEMVQRLLDQGVSPNNSDEQGRSPLHLASCRGYTEIVNLLLTHGADPNVRDSIGNTPLHLAAVTSKISVVTLLLLAGTNVLSSDNHGHNPLQLAQTKLRLIQNCQGSDMNRIKDEVRNIIGMLLAYLQKQRDAREQVEALSNFCSRLTLSSTSDQLQDDVRSLLANLDSLSLTN